MKRTPSLQDVLGKQKQLAPGLHPGIGLNQLKKLKCECGSETFTPCAMAYLASPLQAVSGLPTLVQIPQGFICTSCGKLNAFENPQDKTSKIDVSEESESGTEQKH